MPSIPGMIGHGYYDANSGTQRAAIDYPLAWLLDAIDQWIPQVTCEHLGILDVGSSEGGNAIHGMCQIVRHLRTRTDRPIWSFFCDLPSNDFNHLFLKLFEKQAAEPFGHDVFPGVIAGNGFRRLVPPRTLHIATSFNALGYLETKPDTPLPNYLTPFPPSPDAPRDGVFVTEEQSEPYRQQAAQDMANFYKARAEELVTGGKLLVQTWGRHEKISTGYSSIDVMSDALLDMIDAGRLPRKAYEDLRWPAWMRNLEELLEPIKSDPALAAAFRIDKAESYERPTPFNAEFEKTGDRAAWATQFTSYMRAWAEPVIRSAMPAENQNALIDEMYQRVEQRLREQPERYPYHFACVAALLTRL